MKLIYHKDEMAMVQACLDNDPVAQEKFYQRFARKMFGVCLGYAKNEESAKDLLQEGFIKVFRNLDKYDGSGSLEGWVRRTIVHNNIDQYRKESRQVKTTELNPDIADKEGELVVTNQALKQIEADDFHRITQDLADGYRIILNLYFVEGYSHPEIAEHLGISVGTSKSQMHKAKQSLIKNVLPYLDEDTLAGYGK